jgi:hypothetical protein
VSYDSVPHVARSTALALRPEPQKPWEDIRLQRLWLATQRRQWQTLAIASASHAVQTLPIAQILAQIGWCFHGQPTCVFDLRDLSMRLTERRVCEMDVMAQSGARVFLALRTFADNPTGLFVAKAADAVLLCVGVGDTPIRTAESTIADIGRDRVLGTILVHERSKRCK